MCHRKNGRLAHIVVLCFALILSLCVASTAYNEDFDSVLKMAKNGNAEAQFEDKSEEGNAPASAIMNMMISELHKTGAFELLEREHLDVVMNERKLLNTSDTSTAAKLGRIAGAQYIITGAITLYYYSEKGSGFLLPILGAATQAKTAYVVIDSRIIDVETGKIVYASGQTGDATNKAKTSITNYNKMIGGLLGMATRNAVEKHVSAMRGLTLEI